MDQAKAKGVGKRGRQAMNRHFQERGGPGACIAGETLIPPETPMRTLSSGLSRLPVYWLVSSPIEASQKKEERFVNEATGTTDAGCNSVANHPKGLGKERVREEVEMGEAQATSVELPWGEVEALSKQMRRKRWAKPQH